MDEPVFVLFGEKAKKMIKALEKNKVIRYRNDSVEGRTVLKVYVD